MQLSNATYDLLKKVVQVVLPGLATLYAGLAQLWNFPNVTAVVGTITLVATFLGLVLSLSSRQYNKTDGAPDADLLVSHLDGEKYLSLALNGKNVDDLAAKSTVRFNVVHNTETAD